MASVNGWVRRELVCRTRIRRDPPCGIRAEEPCTCSMEGTVSNYGDALGLPDSFEVGQKKNVRFFDDMGPPNCDRPNWVPFEGRLRSGGVLDRNSVHPRRCCEGIRKRRCHEMIGARPVMALTRRQMFCRYSAE